MRLPAARQAGRANFECIECRQVPHMIAGPGSAARHSSAALRPCTPPGQVLLGTGCASVQVLKGISLLRAGARHGCAARRGHALGVGAHHR